MERDDAQQQDKDREMIELLEALQKVDKAGLKNEALLLAWGCGLATDFNRFQQNQGD